MHHLAGTPLMNIARYFECSTLVARRYLTNPSEEELRKEIAKNMDHIRMKGLEYSAKTSVDFISMRDEVSMEPMR